MKSITEKINEVIGRIDESQLSAEMIRHYGGPGMSESEVASLQAAIKHLTPYGLCNLGEALKSISGVK